MLSSSHPSHHVHFVEVSRSLALFSMQIKGRRCCSVVRGAAPEPVALPRNHRSSSAASCHRGAAVGNRGPGCSSSGSLDGCRPAGAAGRRPPPRRGYGVGAAGAGGGSRSAGFGCRAGGASRPRTITPVTINEQLLQPLCLQLDANVHAVKHQETEQIKTLNNKFASFIDKVRLLEQQNKVLETKWSFLQAQKRPGRSAVPALQAFIAHLKEQLEALGCDRARLETDLKAAQQQLENNRKMYKDERSRRPRTDSQFVALKKDAGCFFLNKAELEAKLESLKEEVGFLRTFYEEETRQLRANVSEPSVVLQMDNSRDLDLGGVAADVRAQYEDIARRSRAEAQAWHESKFEELRVTAGRNAASLQETKTKIAELTRSIQTLSRGLCGAKDQRRRLEDALAAAEQRGGAAVQDAKRKLSELQTALQRSRAELARQLRDCQQLSSARLGLDIEIVTYKKLLEGEESRWVTAQGCTW
ncbi:keratin, type II cytoskeletal cochleal-like [Columba livia]|uniref:Keratin, type II cytoskeletal cochleal-like n=1 Tax=Columba livia TaxID=8932 RepID=A0A2I0LMI4_COLLI|nr:keratin, type II cytoskeletal cochleal-like [Columba livia]